MNASSLSLWREAAQWGGCGFGRVEAPAQTPQHRQLGVV